MAIRRTNNGVPIDMDALMAANPDSSPAVGNMGVNAKGDKLGLGGEVVISNEDRVREYYQRNPRASATTSLKGEMPQLTPDAPTAATPTPPPPQPDPVQEPEEFDAPVEQQIIGYEEVEDENGNFTMVPIYK